MFFFFFSSRRRHTRFDCDWSSDVCSSDLSMREDLEIEQPYVVPGLPDRCRDALQAERFEPQVDLRIHESAGMDEQDAHGSMTSAAAARGVAFILNSALCSGPMNRESLRVGREHAAGHFGPERNPAGTR